MSHWRAERDADRVSGLIGKAAQGWFVALSPGAPATCAAAPDARGGAMTIPPPPGVAADLGTAPGDAGADALAAAVAGRIAPLRVTAARYFRMPPNVGWSAVSTFVAGKLSPGGTAPRPRFVDGGLDMLDEYARRGDRPAFAVAMARAPARDGTHLVGYFDLAD